MSEQTNVPIVNEFLLNFSYEFIPTIILSATLGLFTDFVIITQSSTLDSYKYYLLNKSIWAQIWELIILTCRPTLLLPYLSGFIGGMLRERATSEFAAMLSAFALCVVTNMLFGVFLSLMNRYLLLFHYESKQFFENKCSLVFVVFTHLTVHCFVFGIIGRSAEDHDNVVLKASIETHGALEPFYNESSFMYISENGGLSRSIIRIAFVTSVIYVTIIVVTLIWFTTQVLILKKTSAAVSEHSRGLLISAIIQAVAFLCLGGMPTIYICFAWGFAVPNTSYIGSWLVTLMSFHGIIDALSTLYFVTPYRKFCKRLVRKAWFCKAVQPVAANVAPSSGFTSEPLAPQ